MTNALDDGPLAGVAVLEAASYVSGPFCGQALVDLGANVTKVEPPSGDPYRRFGPQDDHGGVMFRAVNRSKRSVILDLKTDDGIAVLHGHLDSADVLISNWRPAVALGLGLDTDTVRRRWPRLVWVRISGFGQNGPLAEAPAFDSIIQARTGVVSRVGTGDANLVPMYLADKVTAMLAAQSVLSALLQRGVTGSGMIVDLAMVDALAYFNSPDLFAGHQTVGREDDRVARQLAAPKPLATSDGAIVISPVSGQQLKRCLAAAGLEDRVADLKNAPDPTTMTELFYELMSQRLFSSTTGHWVDIFEGADVPVTAVLDVSEHLADPQVVFNEMYRVGVEPGLGAVRRPRYPSLFDGRTSPGGNDAAPRWRRAGRPVVDFPAPDSRV